MYEGANIKNFSDMSSLQRGQWNRCNKEAQMESCGQKEKLRGYIFDDFIICHEAQL